MPADNKDDDPVTFKVFNAFQKEIFERFDAMQKQLDEGRAEREEDRKAREEDRKAREEERKAREEEKKKREEVQNEIWKELGEYNLTGAIKKTILLHYGKFFVIIYTIFIYFTQTLILFTHTQQ
jgi:thiamine pyrophosphate-dependent acetolactate synthase large subunit-like protein